MKAKEKRKSIHPPMSIKDILREMKDQIDLMMDLSLSAVMFGNKDLAEKVKLMETEIHDLSFLLTFQIIQTHSSSYAEAKSLEPISIIGHSIDKIADALMDIARTVEIADFSAFSRLMWEQSVEQIVIIEVQNGSILVGKKIEDLKLRSMYNLDLIAFQRENKWYFDDFQILQPRDQLILRGELSDLENFAEICGISPDIIKMPKIDKQKLIEKYSEIDFEIFSKIRKDFIQITDLAESMVDFAFVALFYSNKELTTDIFEMEEQMDQLTVTFERNILFHAHNITHYENLAGLLRITFSCEMISDACRFMVENLLKGFKPHPILQKAFQESEENVVREIITENSFFKGKKYAEVSTKRYSRGFYIVAIRRDNDWIYNFSPDFLLKQGDLLIGIGPQETLELWRKSVNPLVNFDNDDTYS